jgi:hypothetical protein
MPSPDHKISVETPTPDSVYSHGALKPFAERMDLTCDEYNVWKIMQS